MATDQTTRLEAATVKAENGSQIVYDFANGPATATVTTASGPIPTLAGKLAEISETLAISAGIYPTTAAGLAATNNGQVFLVYASDDDDIIYRVYQNQNGTAFDTGKNTISGTDLEQALAQASQAATNAQAAADSVAAVSDKLNQLGTSTGATLVGFQSTTLAAMMFDINNIRQMGATGLGSQDVSDILQAMVSRVPARSAQPIEVTLPAGDFKITKPIVTGDRSIVIRGAGPNATRILCSHTGDVFQHGLNGKVPLAHFELHNLGIYATIKGSGIAINIQQDTSTSRFILKNVFIGSFSSQWCFKNFVVARGAGHVIWDDTKMDGGSYTNPIYFPDCTQVGCLFISDNNNEKAFVFNIRNCPISAIQNSVRVEVNGVPGNSGSIEGMIFENCGGRCVTGPWFKLAVPNSAQVWHPPYFVFERCNMEGPGTIIDIESASEVHVTACLHYIQAPNTTVPVSDFIKLVQCQRVFIHDNTLAMYSGAVINNFVSADSTCQSISIRNNNFQFTSGGTVAGGVMIGSGVTDPQVGGNRYLNWPANVMKERDENNNPLGPKLEAYGAGRVRLASNGLTVLEAYSNAATNTAGYVMSGGTTSVITAAQGTETNIGMVWDAKGGGSHNLRSNGGRPILNLIASDNAVNYTMSNASRSGFGPLWQAVGTDTNVPIRFKGQGTGPVAHESGTLIMGQTKAAVLALSASAYTGQTFRLTDVSQRFATSDGSVWRYQDGTQVT